MPEIVMLLNGQEFVSAFFYEFKIQNNIIYTKQIFFNIINVFTVTFDQFNVTFWRKKNGCK